MNKKKHIILLIVCCLCSTIALMGCGNCEIGDCRNGRGRLKLPGVGVYGGEFKNDKYHGKGKLTLSNGRVVSGTFQDGQFVIIK